MRKLIKISLAFSLLLFMACNKNPPPEGNSPSLEGASCSKNEDCKAGLFCKNNICSKPCKGHEDCNMLEQHCEEGFCLPGKSTECGNGRREADEACDDGGTKNGDGCDGTCHIESGFNCYEDANKKSICRLKCGDGLREIDESCDDGNNLPNDGCDPSCRVENGYQCDDDEAKKSICRLKCGNGQLEVGEACDDGDTENGNGCSSTCTREDGYQCSAQEGEKSICTEICGDGIKIGREECDDGGNVTGDGCNDTCHLETGYTCRENNAGRSTCSCADGYYGETCAPCPGLIESGSVCYGHGTCADSATGDGACECDFGFDGTSDYHCSKCLPGFDEQKGCQDCRFGYYGQNCQNTCPGLLADGSAVCSSHGDCNDGVSGDGQCNCDPPELVGQDCSGCPGNFTNYEDGCTECIKNYYGINCDFPCPSTDTGGVCDGHGTCDDGRYQSGKCTCSDNWLGNSDCSECTAGYYGSTCKACPACVNGGSCTGGRDNTTGCVCPAGTGWSGTTCSICNSHWQGANCNTCADLYTGSDCKQCRDTRLSGNLCDNCKDGGYFNGTNCVKCTKPNGNYNQATDNECQFTDPRDNKVYPVVAIGDQIWLGKNMSYNGSKIICEAIGNTLLQQRVFIATYGCLYNFDMAQDVCPDGWRLPNFSELTSLVKTATNPRELVTGTSAFLALIAQSGWTDYTGLDSLGFAALPAGALSHKETIDGAYFWSNMQKINYSLNLSNGTAEIIRLPLKPASTLSYSVRCIKDQN